MKDENVHSGEEDMLFRVRWKTFSFLLLLHLESNREITHMFFLCSLCTYHAPGIIALLFLPDTVSNPAGVFSCCAVRMTYPHPDTRDCDKTNATRHRELTRYGVHRSDGRLPPRLSDVPANEIERSRGRWHINFTRIWFWQGVFA